MATNQCDVAFSCEGLVSSLLLGHVHFETCKKEPAGHTDPRFVFL